jgi:tetratricopeptide (TPR) repeat protein
MLFFGFWFLLLLVPGMLCRHKLGSSAYDYLEHRAYLPSVGLVVILAALIGNGAPARLLISSGALCLGLLALLSHQHSKDYRNPVAFYDAVLRASPNNSLAHSNRGIARYRADDPAGAMEDYDIAIRLEPRNDKAFNNRGNMKFRLNDPAAARKDFDEAIRLNPNYAEAYNGRGAAELQLQQFTAATDDFTKAIALAPGFAEPYNGRGFVYAALGNVEAAQRDYEQALRLKPDFPAALANLNRLKQAPSVTPPVPAPAVGANGAGITKEK